MTNIRLENQLCDTCKVDRVYRVCERKHGICDEVIGCPNYIPTEFYYRGGVPWNKTAGYGYTYYPAHIKNEDIAKAVKDNNMVDGLVNCASKIGALTKDIYDFLYEVIQEKISINENNANYQRKCPEEYNKCLAENVNICIGRFFAYIQRMEDNGFMFWDDFVADLKRNNSVREKDITITYQENNTRIVQNLIFEQDNIITDKKGLIFEHGRTRYNFGHNEKDRTECVIKVYKNQISKIEKGKADWITSIRRYTLIFRDNKKMYFDMY